MLRLHQLASDEIREAAAWYEDRSVGLGSRFIASVREIFERLESNPEQFAELETIAGANNKRRVLVEGFPYLLVFELFGDEVFVYAIVHASRRPNYWRQRKRKEKSR
jgi:toxin ParE1/3/4